jgi:hypothetical protein
MNKQQAIIETSVEGIRDAVVKAGFRPGRRVRVSVEYTDASEARESEHKRLSGILDQYPLPPEFHGLTEEQTLTIADEAIAESRRERRTVAK